MLGGALLGRLLGKEVGGAGISTPCDRMQSTQATSFCRVVDDPAEGESPEPLAAELPEPPGDGEAPGDGMPLHAAVSRAMQVAAARIRARPGSPRRRHRLMS